MADFPLELTVGVEVEVSLSDMFGFTITGTLGTADTHAGMPPGLTYAGAPNARFYGTPTEVGEWRVKVRGQPGSFTHYVDVTVVAGEPEPEDPEDPGPDPRQLTVGVPAEVDAHELAGAPQWVEWDTPTGLPPGLTWTGGRESAVITGTPTTAGSWTIHMTGYDDDGYPHEYTLELTVSEPGGGDPDPEDPDPEDPDPEDPDPEDPDPEDPDPEDPDPEDPDPEDPDPEDPDPEDPDMDDDDDPFVFFDPLAKALAPRVAAFVGRPGDDELTANAEAQIPIVSAYIRGYTRGRGFADDIPAGPLRAVIVSATARLATNPEQVTVFTTGDYSERPARLAGWTLAEIGVLHRYRVVSA